VLNQSTLALFLVDARSALLPLLCMHAGLASHLNRSHVASDAPSMPRCNNVAWFTFTSPSLLCLSPCMHYQCSMLDRWHMCREGVLGQDADLAKWLRKNCSTPVLLAANKAERRGASGTSGMCSSCFHLPCLSCIHHQRKPSQLQRCTDMTMCCLQLS